MACSSASLSASSRRSSSSAMSRSCSASQAAQSTQEGGCQSFSVSMFFFDYRIRVHRHHLPAPDVGYEIAVFCLAYDNPGHWAADSVPGDFVHFCMIFDSPALPAGFHQNSLSSSGMSDTPSIASLKSKPLFRTVEKKA